MAKHKVANGTKSHRLNRSFANKGNLEKGLGQLFTISSSTHFFNETDLKQHLSKIENNG